MLRAENVWAVGRSWRLPVLAWSESGEAFVIGERGLQLAVQQQGFLRLETVEPGADQKGK